MENNDKIIERNGSEYKDASRQKEGTCQKVILFAIGVLVGAVIATSAFLICVKTLGVNNNSESSMQMPGGQGGTPPEMPSGSNGQSGTPPEMPSGQSGQSSSGTNNSSNSNS